MNYNDLSSFSRVNFRFNFERVKDTAFFLQEFDLPEVSLESVLVPTQSLDLMVPGTKLTFGETFTMNFLLDEELRGWSAVFDWLWTIRSPEDTMTHKDYPECVSDAVLSVLGNNRQVVKRIRFIDCWPRSIVAPQFRTTDEVDQPVMGTAVFSYAYFKPEPVGYPYLPTV